MFYKNKDKVDIFLLVHVSDVHSFRNRDHTWRQLGRHRYTHIGIGCVDLMYNDKDRIRVHCIVRLRDISWARIRIYWLSPETLFPHYYPHHSVRNSGKQNLSSTHNLFTPIEQNWHKHNRRSYVLHIHSFWGHSLHRMVFPVRFIARTMDVENIGHSHLSPAYMLVRPRGAQCSIR